MFFSFGYQTFFCSRRSRFSMFWDMNKEQLVEVDFPWWFLDFPFLVEVESWWPGNICCSETWHVSNSSLAFKQFCVVINDNWCQLTPKGKTWAHLLWNYFLMLIVWVMYWAYLFVVFFEPLLPIGLSVPSKNFYGHVDGPLSESIQSELPAPCHSIDLIFQTVQVCTHNIYAYIICI